MDIDEIRTLYNYNAWANRRILDTAAQITPEQFHANVGASFPSMHDTLVHTMSSQWMWLSRWQGVSPSNALNPAEFPDLKSIDVHWDRVQRNTMAFLATVDSHGLARVVDFTDTRSQHMALPLWQLMLHQVNHSTQHRSEAAVMLTQFGHSPGLLDFYHYLYLQTKTANG